MVVKKSGDSESRLSPISSSSTFSQTATSSLAAGLNGGDMRFIVMKNGHSYAQEASRLLRGDNEGGSDWGSCTLSFRAHMQKRGSTCIGRQLQLMRRRMQRE